MKWTTERPTKAGFYWYREGEADNFPVVVNVAPEHDFAGPWDDGSETRLSHMNGEWSGPLEPPDA